MQRCFAALVGLLVLIFAGSARATVLVPLDTRSLTDHADRVVLGIIESSTSHWTADRRAIYTDVTVRVTRAYKGARAGELLVVRREGGSLDGVGMRVYGAADFFVGEEVLLFLETRGGHAWTVGMAQGKLHVTTRSDGRKFVAADLTHVAFAKPSGEVVTPSPRSGEPRALEEVEREILAHPRSQP
jgi:hypothetical protein